jgi:hypothetical protein
MPFASASVPVHIARGVVGLVAAVGAFAGVGVLGPAALLLLIVTVAAWRGCPTCWALGLAQTIERERDCACAARPE